MATRLERRRLHVGFPVFRAHKALILNEKANVMLISEENLKNRNRILGFEKAIEEMHLRFQKYLQRTETRMPDWEKLERDLIIFSRRKLYDLELSKQLERVLYKFQTRKKIWLKWVDEFHRMPKK